MLCTVLESRRDRPTGPACKAAVVSLGERSSTRSPATAGFANSRISASMRSCRFAVVASARKITQPASAAMPRISLSSTVLPEPRCPMITEVNLGSRGPAPRPSCSSLRSSSRPTRRCGGNPKAGCEQVPCTVGVHRTSEQVLHDRSLAATQSAVRFTKRNANSKARVRIQQRDARTERSQVAHAEQMRSDLCRVPARHPASAAPGYPAALGVVCSPLTRTHWLECSLRSE